MRAAWTEALPERFVVRDVQRGLPNHAYTTLMTTVNRLAEKGLLRVQQIARQKAYSYARAGSAAEFLATASKRQVGRLRQQYGEAALAAFAAELEALTPAQRERLQSRAGHE